MSPNHPLHAYIARGPVIAAHYRLVGPHARSDLAAETIRATPVPLVETACAATPIVSEPLHGSPAERVMMMLRGNWSIDRTVDPGGHFVGTACCTELPDRRLMQAETGTLHLPDGTVLEGGNRYIYALRDGTIDVTFADGANAGAHFVDLAFSPAQDGLWPLQSGGRHQCRLDQYDAILRLETPDRYVMTFVGPRPAQGVRQPRCVYACHLAVWRDLQRRAALPRPS